VKDISEMREVTTADASRAFDPGHEDIVHDLAMDYYGRRLATCSSDRAVKIFDVVDETQQQNLLAEIKGHDGPVWQVAWAHPKFGSILASCSYDRRVIIWKESPANVWSKVYEYSHESSVNGIAFAPQEFGLSLACASSDSTISVITLKDNNTWDVNKFQAHNIGCNAVSWGPPVPPGAFTNPQALSTPPVKRLVSGGCDNMVKIWRFIEGENRWMLEETLDGHSDWVRDVAWAPSVGLPYTTIASCSQDNTVLIWEQTDQMQPNWKKHSLPRFNAPVWRLSWSLIGNILAVTCGDSTVTLWKEALDGEWKKISSVGEPAQAQPGAHPDR